MKRSWLPKVLWLAAVALLLGNRGFRRFISNTLAIKRLETRFASLKKEEADLNDQIDQLKKSDNVLESSARRELGYLKPDEVEYRFPPPKK